MKKKSSTANPNKLDSRLLQACNWLDVRQAADLLNGLMGGRNFLSVRVIYSLYRAERINAYVRFTRACWIKLYRRSADGDLEPVRGAPLYRAEGYWQLLRLGQGVNNIERLALEVGERSPEADAESIWVEGIGPKKELIGLLQLHQPRRRPRTAARRSDLVQPSSLPDDYVNASCLPSGALVEFAAVELERFVRQHHLDRPAPSQKGERENVRVWRALSLLLFGQVSERRPYAELGDDLIALARDVHEELVGKGGQSSQQELLGCLLFAADLLKPDSLNAAEVHLAAQLKPSLACLYDVNRELAIHLHGFDPTANKNPCISKIANNIDYLGLDKSRTAHTVRRQLKRAVQEHWPAELERLAED